MDPQVLSAMARWPDVPAVFGWLSLSEAGQWRLHPLGDALNQPESAGESITSPQILAFMDRNYSCDEAGQWYFQNGPQRVYVRLDAAPYTVHTTTDTGSGRLKLRTHTGLDINEIHELYLDETGRLYAATDRGPALVSGRDLTTLFDSFELAGTSQKADQDSDLAEVIAQCIDSGEPVLLRSTLTQGFSKESVALRPCARASLESMLRFQRRPSEATPRSTSMPASKPGAD